jgi:hypothetical protein
MSWVTSTAVEVLTGELQTIESLLWQLQICSHVEFWSGCLTCPLHMTLRFLPGQGSTWIVFQQVNRAVKTAHRDYKMCSCGCPS